MKRRCPRQDDAELGELAVFRVDVKSQPSACSRSREDHVSLADVGAARSMPVTSLGGRAITCGTASWALGAGGERPHSAYRHMTCVYL